MPTETPNYDESLLSALDDDPTEFAGEFDPEADYAAPPPPLPDGPHMLKLVLLGAKDKDGVLQEFVGPRSWGPNISNTYFTQIEGIVVDPGGPQDGKRTTRFNVTTHPEERRNGASSASLVYRAITGQPIPGVKPAQHMKAVLDLLRGQTPIVWAKTQLEGEAQEASKAFQEKKKAGTLAAGEKGPKTFRGEKAFMENGKVTGRTFDPDAKEIVVGRPAIVDLKPQSYEGK